MASPRLITAAEAALDDLGDVKGPGPVTDGNIALFDGTTGTLLKAAGVVEGVATIDATTNVLTGDGAGNAIDSGSAIGDLGSLLSLNTARVDASGSDETGTIGNLSKPFLTVQAAVDAIIAQESFDSSIPYCIDVGLNTFADELTIDTEVTLLFRGASGALGKDISAPSPWESLTLTAAARIFVQDCELDNSGITTSDDLDLVLENVDLGGSNIISTAGSGKHLTVISPTNSAYNMALIQADDISTLVVIGLSPYAQGSTIACATSGPDVLIRNCSPPSVNDSIFTMLDVSCVGDGPVVVVMNSVLRNVDVGTGGLTLIGSQILGTITAGGGTTIDSSGIGVGIAFPDADPLVAGAPYWDGATLKKSAGP